MSIDVRMLAFSVFNTPKGLAPIATMQLRYPRFIHSEFMTHRDFSRNASSSRAIKIERSIDAAKAEIAYPVEWGADNPGMQSRSELPPDKAEKAKEIWRRAAIENILFASQLQELGAHKQIVNRILEPYSHISVVVTATQWDNFFALRCHPDADPTMRALADAMRETMLNSTPQLLGEGEWHLPYCFNTRQEDVLQSVAMCARVSYLRHDGEQSATRQENETLAERLLESRHLSPFEHQCRPAKGRFYNLHNWRSFRYDIENPEDGYKTPFRKYTPKGKLHFNPKYRKEL